MLLYHFKLSKGIRKMNSFSDQFFIQNKTLQNIRFWDTTSGFIKYFHIKKCSLSCLKFWKYFFCERISGTAQKITFKKACFLLLKFAQKFVETFEICTVLSVGGIEKFDVNINSFDVNINFSDSKH